MPSTPFGPPARVPRSTPRFLLAATLLLLLPATAAYARSSDDHVSFGNDITVAEGQSAGDIVCIFCSAQLHGDVKGDVVTLFGSISLDSGQSISGDIAVVGGDVALADESSVGGSASIVAGDLSAASTATIRGDRVIFPGRFWLLVPFAPFLILIGLIWLIVYLIRRNRYQFPAYPNGRRI